MAANATSRKTVRDALAALLSAELTGVGNPVEVVYGYKVSTLQGQSPVVVVTSTGSQRPPLLPMGNVSDVHSRMHFSILVFVAEATGTGWTDQDAEDTLDEIEKKITDVLADNRETALWRFVDYDGASHIIAGDDDGKKYALEIIPIYIENF